VVLNVPDWERHDAKIKNGAVTDVAPRALGMRVVSREPGLYRWATQGALGK
jgi:hypothetical protein